MKKKIYIVFILLLLLGGCGGSGKSVPKEQRDLEKRDTILIIYNYPKQLCTVKNVMSFFKDLPATKNSITLLKDNEINCKEYKRNETHKNELKFNMEYSCTIINALEEEKCYELQAVDQSCVLGVDWSLFGL